MQFLQSSSPGDEIIRLGMGICLWVDWPVKRAVLSGFQIIRSACSFERNTRPSRLSTNLLSDAASSMLGVR